MLIWSVLLRFLRSVVSSWRKWWIAVCCCTCLFESMFSGVCGWVDNSHGGTIYMEEIGKRYNPGHTSPPLFFFLESHLLLNIYNHTLSGMPRNDKEIDTVIFCVICLVLWIIFSHSEGMKQLGDGNSEEWSWGTEARLSPEANTKPT